MRYSFTRQEVRGSIHGRVLGNFPSDTLLLSAGSSSGVHSASNREDYQGISSGVKCGRRIELITLLS